MMISRTAFLLLTVIVSFAACQSSPKLTQTSDRGVTYQGQLRYAGGGNPIIGEIIVRSESAEDLQIEFFSGPGFPLMRLRVGGGRGVAEGMIARGRWQGSIDRAPAQVAGWFVLPEVFQKLQDKSGVLRGKDWTASSVHSGGRLTRLEVQIEESGETFTFHFGT